jgi:aryl-alcohol dehydrogenase-like predicted oxidoreductase
MTLPVRTLGDLSVSAIGLGCLPFSRPPMRELRDQAMETIHSALDAGVTLLDTADIYAPAWNEMGHNERLVAEAVRTWNGDKSKIVIATKGGITRGEGETWGRNGNFDYFKKAAEASCEALGVDVIEVWQHHRMDPSMTFVDQFANVLRLKETGLVKRIALSNVTDEMLAVAIDMGGGPKDGGVISVQNERSPLYRVDDDVLARCTKEGIAYLPWSPLGGMTRAQEQRPEFAEIAEKKGVSPQVIALAWLLQASPMMIPIPGASRPQSILDSITATSVELSGEEFAYLDGSARSADSMFPDDLPDPKIR